MADVCVGVKARGTTHTVNTHRSATSLVCGVVWRGVAWRGVWLWMRPEACRREGVPRAGSTHEEGWGEGAATRPSTVCAGCSRVGMSSGRVVGSGSGRGSGSLSSCTLSLNTPDSWCAGVARLSASRLRQSDSLVMVALDTPTTPPGTPGLPLPLPPLTPTLRLQGGGTLTSAYSVQTSVQNGRVGNGVPLRSAPRPGVRGGGGGLGGGGLGVWQGNGSCSASTLLLQGLTLNKVTATTLPAVDTHSLNALMHAQRTTTNTTTTTLPVRKVRKSGYVSFFLILPS